MNFYPMRPLNGGTPDRVFVRDWAIEPKYNGWRCILNTKTGKLYNRHKTIISISSEMKTAVDMAIAAFGGIAEWVDCEGLERRHKIGQGTLIVLDLLIPGTYAYRKHVISRSTSAQLGPECVELSIAEKPKDHFLYTAPYWITPDKTAGELCKELKIVNSCFGADYYEGLVCKKPSSVYTASGSSERTTSDWIKHRFV